MTITKIAVDLSGENATDSYITVKFDRELAGLTIANFDAKDSSGKSASITKVTASFDNMTYTLNGNFTAGKEYTVTVTLAGVAVNDTHELINSGFTVEPVRSGGGSRIIRYTISFNTNGGSEVSNKSVAKNNTLAEPTAPTKDGYDFAGWYTDKVLKEKYDFSQNVTKSFTLYAAWRIKGTAKNQIILTIGKKEAEVSWNEDTRLVTIKGKNLKTARMSLS